MVELLERAHRRSGYQSECYRARCSTQDTIEVIKRIFGQDLLATHIPKKLTTESIEKADIILAMTGAIKNELPQEKSCTPKEYAGSSGDIWDPFGQGFENYLKCAYEMSGLMDNIVEKLV
jgi:protein-tyrosine-phosphatase